MFNEEALSVPSAFAPERPVRSTTRIATAKVIRLLVGFVRLAAFHPKALGRRNATDAQAPSASQDRHAESEKAVIVKTSVSINSMVAHVQAALRWAPWRNAFGLKQWFVHRHPTARELRRGEVALAAIPPMEITESDGRRFVVLFRHLNMAKNGRIVDLFDLTHLQREMGQARPMDRKLLQKLRLTTEQFARLNHGQLNFVLERLDANWELWNDLGVDFGTDPGLAGRLWRKAQDLAAQGGRLNGGEKAALNMFAMNVAYRSSAKIIDLQIDETAWAEKILREGLESSMANRARREGISFVEALRLSGEAADLVSGLESQWSASHHVWGNRFQSFTADPAFVLAHWDSESDLVVSIKVPVERVFTRVRRPGWKNVLRQALKSDTPPWVIKSPEQSSESEYTFLPTTIPADMINWVHTPIGDFTNERVLHNQAERITWFQTQDSATRQHRIQTEQVADLTNHAEENLRILWHEGHWWDVLGLALRTASWSVYTKVFRQRIQPVSPRIDLAFRSAS